MKDILKQFKLYLNLLKRGMISAEDQPLYTNQTLSHEIRYPTIFEHATCLTTPAPYLCPGSERYLAPPPASIQDEPKPAEFPVEAALLIGLVVTAAGFYKRRLHVAKRDIAATQEHIPVSPKLNQ